MDSQPAAENCRETREHHWRIRVPWNSGGGTRLKGMDDTKVEAVGGEVWQSKERKEQAS